MPIVVPLYILLTCGQDITVPILEGVLSITILCQIFNGSHPLTMTVYKNGRAIPFKNSVQLFTIYNPTDDDFGTYSFVLSTEHCGAAHAESRILQKGQFSIRSCTIKINLLIGLVSR